jgi:hypothetical protein
VAVVTEKVKLAGPARPLGSPDIPQFHLPTQATKGVYAPRLYGSARISFADRRRRLEDARRVSFLVPLEATTKSVDWESAVETAVMPDALLKDAPVKASYLPLPAGAMELPVFTRWAKRFDRWLARTQRVELTSKHDPPETVTLGPKRGGVSVELVAIVWELDNR